MAVFVVQDHEHANAVDLKVAVKLQRPGAAVTVALDCRIVLLQAAVISREQYAVLPFLGYWDFLG